ncbi:MAG: cyclodehydratase, partial [Mycobacterium sp.]
MGRYVLDPARPVLLRPDGAVQVGWDPRRALLVRPPSGLTARALADLLRRLQLGATVPELQMLAGEIAADAMADLVSSLVDAGVVTATTRRRARAASIRIHGRGPLSDLLASALRCSGVQITQSSRTHAGAAADLAVLTDFLVSDPRVVRDLHAAGVPYL